MRKTLIVGLMAVLVGGCGVVDGGDSDVHPEKSYRIIEIEGHEYIFISRRPWSGEMALAHSGDCKAH